jgi:hypothetical protein
MKTVYQFFKILVLETTENGLYWIYLMASILHLRAPRGGVTRQGVVLTDLQSLCDCQ